MKGSTQRRVWHITTWFVLGAFLFTFNSAPVFAGAENAAEDAVAEDIHVAAENIPVAAGGVSAAGEGVSGAVLLPERMAPVPVSEIRATGENPVNAAVSLEEATKAVKAVFTIPQEFTKFTSGYSQEANRQVWQLSWEAEKDPWGNLTAQVDCQTGEILNMNLWQSSSGSKPQGKLPAISRAEAVHKAEQLVKQLQAQRLGQLKLEEDPGELLELMSWGATSYRINWVRQVQGVPFPQDGITVRVDNQTGLITSYSFQWTEAEFPDAGKAISAARARQIWDETEILQLQYFRMRAGDLGKQTPVKLVYRLTHPSGGVIDALTGKLVERPDGIARDEGLQSLEKAADTANGAVELTPQELEELLKASKLISQEQAEAVVRQWVKIPAQLTLQGARLNRDEWRATGARTWNFNWSYTGEKEPAEDAVRWVSAGVDAETGTLLSFSTDKAWRAQETIKNPPISREQAQKIAADFLSKIQPKLFEQVKLAKEPSSDVRPLEKMVIMPPYQGFNYQRLINNVVFPDNGMTVSVDLNTGEIQAYQFRWNALAFPAVEGIMDKGAIVASYLQRQPLTLQYVQENIYGETGVTKEMRLVYRPVPAVGQQAEAMTDARTGAALDWSGEEIAKQPRAYQFTDVAGHWAAAEIALLGQAGLMGEYGATFHPDEPVTLVQYLRALFMLERGAASGAQLSDDEVMKQAKQRGWLKEELQAGDALNRLLLARIDIRFLGLESAAKIEGIYQAPYRDMKAIPSAEQGYVALSWGLGILRGEQGNFGAERVVTRAQAAVSLIRMLKVETE